MKLKLILASITLAILTIAIIPLYLNFMPTLKELEETNYPQYLATHAQITVCFLTLETFLCALLVKTLHYLKSNMHKTHNTETITISQT